MVIVRPPGLIDSPHSRPSYFALPASAEKRAIPFWLWWNLLSLDAPTIAVLWAILFAQASRARLNPWDGLALALAVWLVYALDRLLDASRADNQHILQARHCFCFKYAGAFLVAIIIAMAAIAWIALRDLNPQERWNGTKIGCLVAAYMVCIHARRGRLTRYLPKEAFVGVLFAVGTTLPLWSRLQNLPWSTFLSWVSFALVCVLNCTAIECWETLADPTTLPPQPASPVRWAGARIGAFALLLSFLSLVSALLPAAAYSSRAFFAVSMAALFLYSIDCYRTRLSTVALRVLADAALALPALLVLRLPS
jgi:hypothetical protein